MSSINVDKSNIEINKSNTVIILDWDDTLFPSSWLFNSGKKNMKSKKIAAEIKTLDNVLVALLNRCSKHGRVVIVTNATLQWIVYTSQILTRTKQILKKIQIISAKEHYGNKMTVINWKIRVFNDLFKNKILDGTYYNIISIGDAKYEYIALQSFNEIKCDKILKAIKFEKYPNYYKLVQQLILLHHNVKNIVNDKKTIDIDISKHV